MKLKLSRDDGDTELTFEYDGSEVFVSFENENTEEVNIIMSDSEISELYDLICKYDTSTPSEG